MNLRNVVLALSLATVGLAAAAPPAQADHPRYSRYQYFRGRDRDDIRRREILRNQLFRLADRVSLAERQGRISRRKANELFRELDDVRDFLRDDRHLSDSEFDRRRDDLEDVARELREDSRRFGYGGGYRGRYDDRYYDRGYGRDRYNDRYYERDRYYDRY